MDRRVAFSKRQICVRNCRVEIDVFFCTALSRALGTRISTVLFACQKAGASICGVYTTPFPTVTNSVVKKEFCERSSICWKVPRGSLPAASDLLK